MNIDGHQQRLAPLLRKPERQLACGSRLPGTLQADDKIDGGRDGSAPEFHVARSEDSDQFVPDDFQDLLGGREGGQDLLAERLLLDIGDELLDDLEVDIGLEQSETNLSEAILESLLRQLPLPAQVLEGALQLFRQVFKHRTQAPRHAHRILGILGETLQMFREPGEAA